MATIINNGKSIHVNGILSMINGKWYVNGKEINLKDLASDVEENDKVINITINLAQGSVIEHLDIESCDTININGNCKRVKTNMGDINVTGDVEGDIHTNMGDIECGNVHGDAHTNMGNVRFRR